MNRQVRSVELNGASGVDDSVMDDHPSVGARPPQLGHVVGRRQASRCGGAAVAPSPTVEIAADVAGACRAAARVGDDGVAQAVDLEQRQGPARVAVRKGRVAAGHGRGGAEQVGAVTCHAGRHAAAVGDAGHADAGRVGTALGPGQRGDDAA
jgi:hypothetical protein